MRGSLKMLYRMSLPWQMFNHLPGGTSQSFPNWPVNRCMMSSIYAMDAYIFMGLMIKVLNIPEEKKMYSADFS